MYTVLVIFGFCLLGFGISLWFTARAMLGSEPFEFWVWFMTSLLWFIAAFINFRNVLLEVEIRRWRRERNL